MKRSRSSCLVASLAVGLTVLAPTPAVAHGDGGRERVRLLDDCHAPSFNAAIGDGTCVGDGDTTFQEFLHEFEEDGDVGAWKFNPDDVRIDHGQGLRTVNRGGEFHTFTEVAQYGGGCVEELNAGQAPVPECGDPGVFQATGVGAGATRDFPAAGQPALIPGLHRYMCLIHPWMRTDVVVEHD